MKTLFLASTILVFSAYCVFAVNAIRFESDTPLEVAVSRLNSLAAEDEIGKKEQPLTVDEVVAAIRGIIPEGDPAMPAAYYEALQQIAISRTIPKGWMLDFTTGWNWAALAKKREFDVWWIDLSPPFAKGIRVVRVRQRFIRCRLLE